MRVRTCDTAAVGNRIFINDPWLNLQVMTRFGGVPLRLVLLDLGVLAVIPVVLVAIHLGIPSAYEVLAFDHAKVRGYTLLTSVYVHGSDTHLYNTVWAYANVIGLPYFLSIGTGSRRWFYQVTLSFLVVLPVLVSITDYLVLGPVFTPTAPTTLGFSSIVAGFVGLYIVCIARLLSYRYSREHAELTGLGLGIIVVQIAAARYNPQLTVVSVAAITATGVLYIRRSVPDDQTFPSLDIRWNRQIIIDTLFVAFLAGTVGMFVLQFFPPPEQIIREATAVNVIGHTSGLVYGLLIALIELQMERSSPVSQFTPTPTQSRESS